MIKKELYETPHIDDMKDLLEQSVKLYGDRPAFKFKKENLDKVHTNAKINVDEFGIITYRQFKYDIDCLGTKLCSMGLKNKRISIISNNRYEWCVSYMSIVAGTGIVVPLDRSLPDNEIESSLIRSEVEAVFFEDKYLDLMKEIAKKCNTKIKYFINFDYKEDAGDVLSFEKLLNLGIDDLRTGNMEFLNAKIDNENMGIMLFTSGTTSMAKIVMLSHKNIMSDIMGVSKVIKVYDTDSLLSFLPLHHTFESTVWLFALSKGAAVAFCDGLKYIAQNLAEYRTSVMVCVPLLFENMYKKIMSTIKDSGKENLIKIIAPISNSLLKIGIDIRKKIFKDIHNNLGGNIRLFISGAAAIDKETVIGFNTFGLDMLQGYGLTETAPVLTVENDKYRKVGSVGLPIPEVEIKIDNPDKDGIGEIIARGPNVMLGYYENEEKTNEVLKGEWFYTGDLGYLDKEGYLFITGRKKDVIVLKNGKNIFPEEVEMLVNRNEYIAESLIYGKPDKDGDLKLCVKIVYKKELAEKMDKQEIEAMLKEHIKQINKTMPPYKYIREIVITDEPLIKTTTQKIKRHEEIKSLV